MKRAPVNLHLSIALCALTGSALRAGEPGELPSGGQITLGSGNITRNGNQLTVTQSSDRMVANWDSFNIGADASVRFAQPSASSVALNRILSANPSQISGALTANGQLFLINPNGILFDTNSRVDVGGLVASSLALGDGDFAAGRYTFSNAGNAGRVENRGSLSAPGGVVALLGPVVSNFGSMNAGNGTALLAAGDRVNLDFHGDGLVSVEIEQQALNALAENHGLVQADGGRVLMSARSASALLQTVVNNDGIVQARSLANRNGRIVLDGGESGIARVAGILDASSADGTGGSVLVSGDKVLIDDGAQLIARGATGGGDILVGGAWQGSDPAVRSARGVMIAATAELNASATDRGDGGTIVAWSDIHDAASVTRVYGTFLARAGINGGNGGRIETSGHWLDTTGAAGDASAPRGTAGLWLYDPYNVTITSANANGSFASGGGIDTWTPSANSSTVLNTDINAKLAAGTNVTITTGAAGGQIGDIAVASAITKSSGNSDVTLTLKAANTIGIDSAIANTGGAGKLHVVLDADNDNGTRDGVGIILLNESISTGGGNLQFGTGATRVLNGVTTMVGGDVYVGGSSAINLTTGGGSVTVNGEMLVANSNGLNVTTSGGNVTFGGLLNSGNTYASVNSTLDWSGALSAAASGTGTGVGDTYLATITSRLENAIAGRVVNYNPAWLGARRVVGLGTNNVWRWVAGPEGAQDGGNGLQFFTQNGSNSANGSGGAAINSAYSNWNSGEPNNYGGANLAAETESALQFVGSLGQWNDLPKTGTTLNYYVRETNLAASPVTVNAGAGAVTFSGAVGTSKALSALSVTANSIAINGGAVTTAGTQTYTGSVALGANTTLANTASPINFSSTVDSSGSARSLTIGAGSGTTTFSGVVGGTSALASLSTRAAAIDTSDVRTTGAQTYNGAVTLGYASATPYTTLTSTSGGVTFASTLDDTSFQGRELDIQATSGSVTFSGAVGSSVQPFGIYVTGNTAIGADMSLGRAEFFSPVTITHDVGITQSCCYGVHFHNTVDGAHALTMTMNDGVIFDGAVGGTNPLTSLGIMGTTFLGANVTTTGTQSYAGDMYLLGTNITLRQTNANTDFNWLANRSIFNFTGVDIDFAIRTSRDIVFAGGGSISSDDGRLNLTLNTRASDGASGALIFNPGGSSGTPVSIRSNGGSISLVGGSSGAGYAIGGSNSYTFGVDAHQDGASFAYTTLDARRYIGGIAQTGDGGNVLIKTKGYGGNVTLHGGGLWAGNSAITTGGGDFTLDAGAQRTGSPTTGGIRYGAFLDTFAVDTDGGAVDITTPAPAADTGLYFSTSAPGAVNSGSGNISLTTDRISVSGAQAIQGTGSLVIRPDTLSTSIGMGAGSGTLSLPQSYFWNGSAGVIKDGFAGITIGRADGTGNINVNGLTFSDPLLLLSGAGAYANLAGAIANAGSGAQSGSFTVRVGGDIVTLDSNSITTQNQSVIFNADRDANQDGAIALGSGSSITTNGGDIIMGGGADPTTTASYGSAAHRDGIIGFNEANPWGGLDGAHLNAGGGNIILRGQGGAGRIGVNLNVYNALTTSGSGTINIVGSGGSSGTGVVLDRATMTSGNGDISITGTSGGSVAAMTYYAGNAISTTGSGAIRLTAIGGTGLLTDQITLGGALQSGNIVLTSDRMTLANSSLRSTGSLNITPYTVGTTIGISGGAGTLSLSANNFSNTFYDGFSQINIGNGGSGAITVGGATTLRDSTAFVSGGNILVNGALAGGGQTLRLTSGNGATVSGNGNIAAANLLLDGVNATYTLNTATANSIGTLAAANVSSINFRNSGSFAVGMVNGVSGISAANGVTLQAEGASADLTLNQSVASTNGNLVLAAGRNFLNNNATDTGINPGAGRYLVYSSNPANTTEGMSGYSKHYSQAYIAGSIPGYAASGNWFLYSVAPVLTVTPSTGTSTYGAAFSFTPIISGLIDGDTELSAGIGGTAVFNVGGAVSGAGFATAGAHDVSYAGGLANGLGYTLLDNSGSTSELIVNQGTLVVSGVTAGNKVYDAMTSAILGGTATVSALSGDSVSVTPTGVGMFIDKNVGTGKGVTVSGFALSGADAANYQIVQPTGLTADITQAALAVTGIDASNKVYDATRAATLVGTAGVNAFGNDDVHVVGAGAGVFADKNVGADKSVSVSGFTLGGTDAANYQIAQPTGITASIAPATLQVTGVGVANKVYDANTTATLNGIAGVNALGADDVRAIGAGVGVFADKNAGAGKAVTVTGFALSGADAGNYLIAQPAGLTADITPASLTLNGLTVAHKPFDGTSAATVTEFGALSGVIADDVVRLDTGVAQARFADPLIGKAKPVTISHLALAGADAANYVLVGQSTNADITSNSNESLNTIAASLSPTASGTNGTAEVSWHAADTAIGDSVAALHPGSGSEALVHGEIGAPLIDLRMPGSLLWTDGSGFTTGRVVDHGSSITLEFASEPETLTATPSVQLTMYQRAAERLAELKTFNIARSGLGLTLMPTDLRTPRDFPMGESTGRQATAAIALDAHHVASILIALSDTGVLMVRVPLEAAALDEKQLLALAVGAAIQTLDIPLQSLTAVVIEHE